MTQTGMMLGEEIVGSTMERTARQHARTHGLVLVRIEPAAGLFEPVEVAVFRTRSGAEIRRTLAQLSQD